MAANAKRRKAAEDLADTVRSINIDLTVAEQRITALENRFADLVKNPNPPAQKAAPAAKK